MIRTRTGKTERQPKRRVPWAAVVLFMFIATVAGIVYNHNYMPALGINASSVVKEEIWRVTPCSGDKTVSKVTTRGPGARNTAETFDRIRMPRSWWGPPLRNAEVVNVMRFTTSDGQTSAFAELHGQKGSGAALWPDGKHYRYFSPDLFRFYKGPQDPDSPDEQVREQVPVAEAESVLEDLLGEPISCPNN